MKLVRELAVELSDRTVYVELTIVSDGDVLEIENLEWQWYALDPIDVEEEIAIEDYINTEILSFIMDIN